MPNRTEQLNVRVTEDQKERWDTFAEESRSVGGVSDLVRRAVHAYIEAQGDPTTVAPNAGVDGTIPENLSERLASIEDQLGGIATTVERTDESVGFIERKMVEPDTETTDFTHKLMGAIPPKEPGSREWRKARDRHEDRPDTPSVAWEGTIDAIADVTDSDPTLVEQSLDALVGQSDHTEVDIQTANVDGEKRYYADRKLRHKPYADGRTQEREAKRKEIAQRQEERR